MGKYILAVDQGTTGSRAFVVDQFGRSTGWAYQEFKQYYPKPGWVEHDPQEIWQSVQHVIREALAQARIDPHAIAAIGITNQRETSLIWDRHSGKPLARAIVWQDRRTAAHCLSAALKRHAAYVHAQTGLRLDPYFSATKLQWLLDHVPGARKKAASGDLCFGTIDTWLLYQLTGKAVHATDYTNASRTMLFNIRSFSWDKKLLKIFDIPSGCLPAAYPSGHVFGHTQALAGLPQGIPIAAMMGDQQAALFGQGCFNPGTVKNTYGTGCFMVLNTGRTMHRSTQGLLTTIACDAQGRPVYALEGSVFIAGAVVQWLRDGLKIIPDAAATQEAVKSIKDTGGVYFVPAFVGLGAPYWQPNARGIISGLTRGSGRPHIIRAALEAIAYQTKDVFDLMVKESGLRIRSLNVDGGACRNDFLMQFQADMLRVLINRPVQIDSTVAGAAHLAGISCGLWGLKDVDRMHKLQRVFRPVMPKAEVKARYRGWQQAVKQALIM